MVQTGELVPDFTATTDSGEQVTLAELTADGPLVLFFYPKAFTPTCTAEACHFRDLSAEFDRVGARCLGVSRDDPDTQQRFRRSHELGFPLLSDPDGELARIFGAKRFGPLWSKRQTFVIGADRRLLASIASERDAERHADEALEVLGADAAGGR